MQKRLNSRYNTGFKQVVINHIGLNINLYLKIITFFVIGICIGIIIINNLPEAGLEDINKYIGNSINSIKNQSEISKIEILKSSLSKNIILVFIIWFLGLTFLGGFLLYFLTLFLGIAFGYTISALMTSFTFIQGTLFFATTLLLQNIITIPSMFFLIIQGIQANKNFFSKQTKSFKYLIAKHSAYSILVILLLIIASFIEVYISGSLVYTIAKYL